MSAAYHHGTETIRIDGGSNPVYTVDGAITAIVGTAPVGAVNNLLLDYYPQREGAERLQFAANLDGVGIQAYHGAPAVENVTGSASGNLFKGELRLNTEDFALHLDQLFPKPWRYRHAQARLSWDWSETGLTLYSPYMRLDGEEGQIAGDMLIRLLRDPEAEDYMDLRVGLRDGDAAYTEKYLPSRSPGMSRELDQWLKTAIRAGHVEQGYFQYQGALSKGAELGARSISLFFKVKDAELAFQPGWPSLREGVGEVLIEDDAVRVRLQNGRLLQSQVSDVTANIPLLHDGKPPSLQLDVAERARVGARGRIHEETGIRAVGEPPGEQVSERLPGPKPRLLVSPDQLRRNRPHECRPPFPVCKEIPSRGRRKSSQSDGDAILRLRECQYRRGRMPDGRPRDRRWFGDHHHRPTARAQCDLSGDHG
mgnify:CR=1 FL=1